MIILEPDDLQNRVVVSALQALDNEDYYAMLDSGTNAIIVPLHPRMEGEVAECQVPGSNVTGPIVQVYEFESKKRLVVALPNSAILVSQEMAHYHCRMDLCLWAKAETGEQRL